MYDSGHDMYERETETQDDIWDACAFKHMWEVVGPDIFYIKSDCRCCARVAKNGHANSLECEQLKQENQAKNVRKRIGKCVDNKAPKWRPWNIYMIE